MAKRYATPAEVRTCLPDTFTDPPVTDEVIQGVIDDQVCFLGLEAWGDCASVASKYAAAHVVLLRFPTLAGGGQQGLVQSEANGPASRSWAITAADADNSWWASTPCGLQYLNLRKVLDGVGVLILGATSRTRRPYGC